MVSECIICKKTLIDKCIDLGSIPLVNNFRVIPQKTKYQLSMGLCRNCKLFQVQKNINPKLLFSDYAHVSSGSKSNLKHIEKVFKKICKIKRVNNKTKILEIGCNDGSFLKIAKKKTKKIVGIDPAKNLLKKIQDNYLELIPNFFNRKSGEYLISKHNKFDIIVALNVIPHAVNVRDIIEYVSKLLSDNGIFLIEGAYFFETIFKGKFDTIYHEHVSSFTLYSLKNLLDLYNLKIHLVEKIPTQGGSIRVIVKKKTRSLQWKKIYNYEKKNGVDKLQTYKNTGKLINKIIKKINICYEQISKYKKVVLLGAPARGVVITNVCKFKNSSLHFAIDDSITKYNKFFPGKKIKVYDWKRLNKNDFCNFVLLSWNYEKEILKKIKLYRKKFDLMVPLPSPKIIKYS